MHRLGFELDLPIRLLLDLRSFRYVAEMGHLNRRPNRSCPVSDRLAIARDRAVVGIGVNLHVPRRLEIWWWFCRGDRLPRSEMPDHGDEISDHSDQDNASPQGTESYCGPFPGGTRKRERFSLDFMKEGFNHRKETPPWGLLAPPVFLLLK